MMPHFEKMFKTLPRYPESDQLAREAFAGDADAQFHWAEALRLGYYGMEVDEVSARIWYEHAARQGHRVAIFLLNNWKNRDKFNLYE